MVYTILIKNGTVIDGTGKAPYPADVGILGDHIKDIGPTGTLGDQADTIIDASNLYVTPGFIDITSHSDTYGTLFTVPNQDSLLLQGVTTILVGNCGYSLAPLIKKEAVDDLARWTSTTPLSIDWETTEGFYDALRRIGVGLNVGTLIGQETLRSNAATIEERELLLQRALDEGAWGLSSNFSFVTVTPEIKEETLRLLKIVKSKNGLWKIHSSDEGKNLLPGVVSIISMARESGVRTVISHFKGIGKTAWHEFSRALRIIDQAREEQIDISFDIFPYLRTGSMLLSFLPAWAREGNTDTILARLNDPKTYQLILAELQTLTLHADRIMIASAQYEKSHIGKTLAEVSFNIGIPPEQAMLEILKINRGGVTVFGKTIHSKNLIRGVSSPSAIIASDGAGYDLSFAPFKDLVHPRSFGAFARFFHRIAPSANLNIETIIQKITSRPAQAMGISDRGILSNNKKGDVAIFHPEEFQDAASYQDPFRYAEGMRTLIINGEVVVQDGTITKQHYGTVLKKS